MKKKITPESCLCIIAIVLALMVIGLIGTIELRDMGAILN